MPKISNMAAVWQGWIKHRFWRFYFSVSSLVFVSIKKIYQTLQTVFHRLSRLLKFRPKYSAARRIFNSLLGVWISRWNTVSRVWYITSNIICGKFSTCKTCPCIHGKITSITSIYSYSNWDISKVLLYKCTWVPNWLTIRLRARVFYEQIVNEAQPSWLSLVENEGV